MRDVRKYFGQLPTLLSFGLLVLRIFCVIAVAAPFANRSPSVQPLKDISQYISSGWDRLTRSLTNCETLRDTKTSGEPVLYLPVEITPPPLLEDLQQRCAIRIEHLPERITRPGEVDLNKIRTHGLLYLENPYVVPGGQFNEMYGWDSYFIILGLLRNDRRDLAKGMVDNFLFEIEHYGGMLNANRSYYLSRSQPPLLTSMILEVYEAEKSAGQADLRWLERAYGFAARDYEHWNEPPHLSAETGLSRYFDHGEGPVPEMMPDYYRTVARFFLFHRRASQPYLIHLDREHPAAPFVEPVFSVLVCDQKPNEATNANCAPPDRVALTAEFYKGDRSMRESGFDVSFRFGPFGAVTHHYAPVCLNSLLYKTEKDLEKISLLIGKREDADKWKTQALERRKRIWKYLWDERRGLFFDYNLATRSRSSYEYATTFYPLWAGLASEKQARAVVHNLPLFERPGGVAMSLQESGEQWDYPYGWAPIQLFVVEGLRRYGYTAEANRVAYKFVSMVIEDFQSDHTIREKYNVITRSSETHIQAGYKENVIGFGWTNGVFLALLQHLPAELFAKLPMPGNLIPSFPASPPDDRSPPQTPPRN
ncbi:MAG: trehalase [Acidobacteria bacterium]|nr:trehalase [Acidobacteriota bacterium]